MVSEHQRFAQRHIFAGQRVLDDDRLTTEAGDEDRLIIHIVLEYGPDGHAFPGVVFAQEYAPGGLQGILEQAIVQFLFNGRKHMRGNATTGGDNVAMVGGDGKIGNKELFLAAVVDDLVRHVPIPLDAPVNVAHRNCPRYRISKIKLPGRGRESGFGIRQQP